MSNERPNASGKSNSIHVAKNETPTQDVVLIVNRAFSAWQSMLLYWNTSIWQNGKCRPDNCAETICDFAATLSLASWKNRINSTDSDPKDNSNAVGILRVALSGSKEDVAQAIINVGEDKWPAVSEWVAKRLPEVLEFWKLKPNPFDELFGVQTASLEHYRNDAEALREIMDRASNRWPVIRDLARSKFEHQTFTWDTMECLSDWLLTRCAGDESQRGWLTLTEVEKLLGTPAAATAETKPDTTPSASDVDVFLKQGIDRQKQADENAAKKKAELDRLEPLVKAVSAFRAATWCRHESDIDRCIFQPEQLESVVRAFCALGPALTAYYSADQIDGKLTATVGHNKKLFACQLYRHGIASEEAELRRALEGLLQMPVIEQVEIWREVGWLTEGTEGFVPDWYRLERPLGKGEPKTQPVGAPAALTTGKQEPQPAKEVAPAAPAITPISPEKPVPLSRLALPRIVEAIGELHHAIENPPAKNWQAPAWLVEQYKQTTAGKLPLEDGEKPNHAWLINTAATEVLNRLTPPYYHRSDDCPEITESSLDRRHKVKLIELRTMLLRFALGESLARNRSEALQVLDFLESVSKQLEGEDGDGGTRKGKRKKQTQSPPGRGGKPPLEKSHPLKFQVYDRIHREHKPKAEHRDTLDRLKGDRDFVQQVQDAKLILNTCLVRKALALFDQRKRDEARKKQDTHSA